MLTAVNDLAEIHIEMGPSHTVRKSPNSVWNSVLHPMFNIILIILISECFDSFFQPSFSTNWYLEVWFKNVPCINKK